MRESLSGLQEVNAGTAAVAATNDTKAGHAFTKVDKGVVLAAIPKQPLDNCDFSLGDRSVL